MIQSKTLKRNARHGRVRRAVQGGFTLLEVIVVLGILVLIAGISSYFLFDQDGTKGQALFTEVSQVRKAADRAKFDANCFPLKLQALVDKTLGTTSTCGIDISTTLKSPYMQPASWDANGNLQMPSVSSTSVMSVTSVTVSGKTSYYLSVSDVPDKIGQAFVTSCNRGATGTTPCAQGTVTGGKGPVTLLVQAG